MSAPTSPRGSSRAAAWTGRWTRLSLESRLLGAMLALLALGLLATGVAATALLSSYLVGRADAELLSTRDSLRAGVGDMGMGGPFGRPTLPSRYHVAVLDADGTTVAEVGDPHGPGGMPGGDHGGPPDPDEGAGPDGDDGRGGDDASADGPDLSWVTSAVAADRAGEPFTHEGETGTWRVLLTPLPDGRTFSLSTPLSDVDDTTGRLAMVVLVVGLVVLAAGALLSRLAVRGSLRPLRRIEDTAAAIAAGDLSRRVPEEGGASTEVGRLSHALNSMLAQIEEAFSVRAESEARMRSFVADASHELRTPLTSIRGFAELYRHGAVVGAEDTARLMRRIEEESTRMAGLVEDLLLLARLDRQRPLAAEPVDLVVVAGDIVHDVAATAPGHEVALRLPPSLPEGGVVVLGDEGRLRQIVLNLVTNAVRHTPPGTRVQVGVRREGGTGGPVGVVEVADDGPGLPAEALGSVFDGFYRSDPSRARGSGGGSGLGLTIVAALVRAHGGEVTVDSGGDRGARFTVRLPLAAEADHADSQVAPR